MQGINVPSIRGSTTLVMLRTSRIPFVTPLSYLCDTFVSRQCYKSSVMLHACEHLLDTADFYSHTYLCHLHRVVTDTSHKICDAHNKAVLRGADLQRVHLIPVGSSLCSSHDLKHLHNVEKHFLLSTGNSEYRLLL